MGLVDYSDSDSDGESSPAPPPPPATTTTKPSSTTADSSSSKKPFQRLVDQTTTGTRKILVNLPTASTTPDSSAGDEPPAKRARTAAPGGSSRFSAFSSFLPPPKKTAPAAASSKAAASGSTTRIGVNLKTSAEAAFSRSSGDGGGGAATGLNLPPPRDHKAPSIPEGQKAAEDVQLVGKPLMFKPLSVSRRPGAAKKGKGAAVAGSGAVPSTAAASPGTSQAPVVEKKKVSLFSLGAEDDTTTPTAGETQDTASSSAYEPLFSQEPTADGHDDGVTGPYDPNQTYAPAPYLQSEPQQTGGQQQQHSLDAIADDLNLSAAERRALFGRGGKAAGSAQVSSSSKIISFDMDREYRHNETLRTSGEQAGLQHNPVRGVQPGKHSLRQLVNQVQSQKDALEDMFAKNKASQREAGGRYGFR